MLVVEPLRKSFANAKNWRLHQPLRILALVAALVVILPNAWISEDAFISLRVAKNILLGYGPNWNINERVQVFTHPLWMVLLTFVQWLFPHNTPAAVIGLCIIFSLLAVALFMRDIKSSWVIVVTMLLMLSSKAFIDYSTSGLENPLLYVLIILFAHEYLDKQRIFWLTLIASFIAITRADAAALVLPAFIPLIWSSWRSHAFWTDILKGITPILGWEIFSLVYYGYFLPNTDYAKVLTNYVPGAIMSQHAFNYFANSLDWDKITLPVILTTLVIADLERKDTRRLFLAAGIILYLLAVVKAGGDYMSGRFFAVPFIFALYLLAQWLQTVTRLHRFFKPALIAVLLSLALVTPQSPITHPLTIQNKRVSRQTALDVDRGYISDEGQFDCPVLCLYNLAHLTPDPPPPGQSIVEAESIGTLGYYANPKTHIIDQLGLGDPLLSHLAADPNSRVGHFYRVVPAGYVASLEQHRNLIQDPCIQQLYSDIRPVVTGPVFSFERFKKIIKLNLGISDAKYRKCAKIGATT
jgi:arabinofuranosyltransferase